MHSGFRRKLNPLMLYCIQDKGCSIKIFDLGGEVHSKEVLAYSQELDKLIIQFQFQNS
ncbi:aspartyl-phosphate phosphatase Spo0E family protein [Domibacillus sp. 8LH]|uniref:aspartyl-phosphate phosphatase Spo0E family protein n=1 Tax=Domibacillus sp. 8LH TaxID=3073900 RepID=UPI0034E0A857